MGYIRNNMIWGFGETWVDLEVLPLKCPSGAGLDVHGDECKTRTSQNIVIHLENTWHHVTSSNHLTKNGQKWWWIEELIAKDGLLQVRTCDFTCFQCFSEVVCWHCWDWGRTRFVKW
jgi:hypothetical protein